MLFVLVLLYVINGQVMLEKPAYKTEIECIKAGESRIAELQSKPSFDAGLYARCIPLPGQAILN